MDSEPASFVARFLEPWNRHDADGAMEFMADDCVWELPAGSEPWGTCCSGASEVRRAIADTFENMPDIRYDLVRYHAGPDLVVLELRVTGTNRDGTRVERQACDILTLKGGKVVAKRSYRKVRA